MKRAKLIPIKYQTLHENLKAYNSILQRNINQAPKSYYEHRFKRYITNIKKDMKTWTIIKEILNKHNSLLPAISKVFENAVFRHLYDYINENELLYQRQYGFRTLHSSETASLETTDIIVKELDRTKLSGLIKSFSYLVSLSHVINN